jgi:hypothetical protein
MDLGNAFAAVNWLAVLCASIAAFLIGWVWYSRKVFGNAWLIEIGLTEESMHQAKMPLIVGGTFALQFVAATTLSMFLGSGSDWLIGLQAGLLIGIGWIATAYGITYLFEQRSLRIFLINTGYFLVLFATMGLILGAWNQA